MGKYIRREEPTPQERFYYILYECLNDGLNKGYTAINAECAYNKNNPITDTYTQLFRRDWFSSAFLDDDDVDSKLCEALADELIQRAKKENIDIKRPNSINYLCLTAYNDNFIETQNHAKLIIAVLNDEWINDYITDSSISDFEYMPENLREWGCVVLDGYIRCHTDTITMIIGVKLGLSEENVQ